MTRVVIHGAGRMAGRVLANMPAFPSYELAGVISRSRPAEELEAEWFPSLEQLNGPVDLLIDFTLPEGTGAAARWCASHGVAVLSGTTGLDNEDFAALKDAALQVPVLWAPNLSQGVALISALIRQATRALGEQADISITDLHHVHKLDAPSGTALALSSVVMEELTVDADEPEISSVREGEIIGEHTVRFRLPEEEIEISHRAVSRDVFARGALRAGEWLVTQEAGYYSTGDWLGFS